MLPILIVLLAGLLASAVGMTAAAVRAQQVDRAAVVDVAWGAGFVLIALATAVVGTVLDEGTGWRRWLVAAPGRGLGAAAGLAHPRPRGRRARRQGGPAVRRDARRPAVRRSAWARGRAPGLPGAGRRAVVRRGAGDGRRGPGRRVVAGRRRRRRGLGDRAVLRGRRRPPARGVQAPAARDPAPVMDQGLWRYTRHPELLRRRLHLVGALAGRRSRLRLGGRAGHRALPGRHDALRLPGHRRQAAREDDDAAARLPGVRRAHVDASFPLPPKRAARPAG